MPFKLSISNDPRVRASLPNLTERPTTGKQIASGANPHAEPPKTDSQRIATSRFTQEDATGFLNNLRGGRHS